MHQLARAPSWLCLELLYITIRGCFSDTPAVWDGHKLNTTDRNTEFPDARNGSGDLEE